MRKWPVLIVATTIVVSASAPFTPARAGEICRTFTWKSAPSMKSCKELCELVMRPTGTAKSRVAWWNYYTNHPNTGKGPIIGASTDVGQTPNDITSCTATLGRQWAWSPCTFTMCANVIPQFVVPFREGELHRLKKPEKRAIPKPPTGRPPPNFAQPGSLERRSGSAIERLSGTSSSGGAPQATGGRSTSSPAAPSPTKWGGSGSPSPASSERMLPKSKSGM
jgi:hypothetical protein